MRDLNKKGWSPASLSHSSVQQFTLFPPILLTTSDFHACLPYKTLKYWRAETMSYA